MTAASPKQSPLGLQMGRYYADPLGFVLDCYPWGRGDLTQFDGPDANQREFLESLGAEVRAGRYPIRMAEASGHGTGKTAQGAWIANWIMSTRPWSQGTVTAGTATQLEARTWAGIQKWTKLCVTSDWWEVLSRGVYIRQEYCGSTRTPEDWKLVAQTCKEENAQSFAGQHALGSTSYYIFDEASAVPDSVYRVAYGGLIHDEDMMFAWGQPERNSGEFHNICFGALSERWNVRHVDSRSSKFTDQNLIAEWLQDYGEDSDWFRVRVLGLPPAADELQYIDFSRVKDARRRQVEVLPDEPLVAGFDVSGGGSAWNVIRFRRGLDARSFLPIRITGEAGRERAVLIARAAEVLRDGVSDGTKRHKVAAMFVDSAFGAPIVERLHTLGFENAHEVNFGGSCADQHCLNERARMWMKSKDWLLKGAIPDDEKLAQQACGPGYHINSANKLVIESKDSMRKRGLASPDDWDAFVLTFARPVAPVDLNNLPRVHKPPPMGGRHRWLG